MLPRDNNLVQLSILGKGEKPRQVLLPDVVSLSLLSLRGTRAQIILCSSVAKVAGSPNALCMGW